MRIEGGIVSEKNRLYLDENVSEVPVCDLSEKRRRRAQVIATVTFFLKLNRRDGTLSISGVGTSEEILSIMDKKLGFKQLTSVHRTEAGIIQAIHKQIVEIERKDSTLRSNFKLTAFLSKKNDQLFFEKIGSSEEIEEILKAKNISYKSTEFHIEESRVRGEFLRALEISPFIKEKESKNLLF